MAASLPAFLASSPASHSAAQRVGYGQGEEEGGRRLDSPRSSGDAPSYGVKAGGGPLVTPDPSPPSPRGSVRGSTSRARHHLSTLTSALSPQRPHLSAVTSAPSPQHLHLSAVTSAPSPQRPCLSTSALSTAAQPAPAWPLPRSAPGWAVASFSPQNSLFEPFFGNLLRRCCGGGEDRVEAAHLPALARPRPWAPPLRPLRATRG